ncbi:heterokaryon incompatibility protein-domain-containing protein [Bisporella sp. PMI_857]|nr:heterokaryon incompatibility protein-domain-containing protein [Bisporella sp. PMI_857]
MRLIHCATLRIEEFVPRQTPKYAIFSHTWGSDEVSFEDMISGRAMEKAGYQKIRNGVEQARRDGLEYFWVDTCCIDKTSSAELTEAINSMYRWYQEATICYVYLADVQATAASNPEFRKSRWFRRGWTIQELIAPRNITFYTARWSKIGTKTQLAVIIYEVTAIPIEVLNHLKRPDEYSVPERMAWATRRETTRVEDRAYCLMGLFGINMPLIYGEGEGAFQRLQKEIMGLTNQSSGLRLLAVSSRPLTIETFSPQAAPPYAILSHTWSTSEVSFQDILVGKAPDRRGYQKIKNFCAQAAHDDCKYLWVDTCCIDKTSSAELQEAICSMYKWYKNARVCYAYLEDYDASSPQSQLSSCKWFKRGWTLQELIAPAIVKFYDSKWVEFGTKDDLCQQISDITGIDPRVLRGADPTKLTVAERMSWASGRLTSRIEDIAYSLMGLFNVFMPMLYGEGNRAFIRLQEEIMKQSEDYTIFAWKSGGSEPSRRGLLAHSPSEFESSSRSQARIQDTMQVISEYKRPDQQLYIPAALTSRGLLIGLPLLRKDVQGNEVPEPHKLGTTRSRGFDFLQRFRGTSSTPGDNAFLRSGTYLALICRSASRNSQNNRILCIWLRKHQEGGIFTRLSPGSVALLPEKRAPEFKIHTIYVLPSGTEG